MRTEDLEQRVKKFTKLFLKETQPSGFVPNKRILYWIIVFVLILVIVWLGYFYKSAKKPPAEKVVPVEVETVSAGSIEEMIELAGWIKANKIVNVESKVQGRIESLRTVSEDGKLVAVEEGVAVTKGQHLAVIDHDVYLAEVAAARANVQAAEVELADAEREEKRIIRLFESGSATEQSRDKAVTTAKLTAAKLNSAKASLELVEINLRESTIVSPIDGIVTAKYIDEGNLIRAGDRIVTVADLKTVKIIVSAAEKYNMEISIGIPVRIKVDAFGEKEFDAEVYSVYPSLDTETHTVQIEIRLKNDELLLKPGMFARVTLITRQKNDAVIIPRDVVLGGKIDQHYVYVVNNDTAHKRFVQVGITQADRYEIVDGLKAGETLVVNGMNYLKDGTKVEVVRTEDIK
jgi:membrane fusion protein (multidrug efflux system)